MTESELSDLNPDMTLKIQIATFKSGSVGVNFIINYFSRIISPLPDIAFGIILTVLSFDICVMSRYGIIADVSQRKIVE